MWLWGHRLFSGLCSALGFLGCFRLHQAGVRLTLHETVRLGKEFWSCVLNMYGWIYVNLTFISLKLKLLLSQGTATPYVVPQIWSFPVGTEEGSVMASLWNRSLQEGFVGQRWFSPHILSIALSCTIKNIKAMLCHNGVNAGKKKTTLRGCDTKPSCDLLYSL